MKFELEINDTDKEVFKGILEDEISLSVAMLYLEHGGFKRKEYSKCIFNILTQIQSQLKGKQKVVLYDCIFDGETIHSFEEDIIYEIQESGIPMNEDGSMRGKFHVKVTWIDEQE